MIISIIQDVAVDGWALTILKPKNVGYASTCNSVGQTCGWCLGYILFTTLESAGYITFSQFLLFWGIVFLVTTTLIAIFKREKNSAGASSVGPDGETIEAYKMLWKVCVCHCHLEYEGTQNYIKLRNIQKYKPCQNHSGNFEG